METPRELRSVDQRDVLVSRIEYDDGTVIAADFGGDEVTLDVVGETAIVVAGDRQVEFDLPEGASDVAVNNGTLTIEE
ncbi:hypothetical protein [Halalkalicoccus sp. NIPERK01]|uniref:DUF7127 family protein n=1 Tax=Halalkalicoccus sp. NIPERK01 TaxID=3053469 RepID=UPI00256EEA7B|nr:hypothetical protein [Halalkalicoccus sp. NIPERK01]MDL5362928.1 hypothetical protein [Halalkalicoccus sp. NIPERK01]